MLTARTIFFLFIGLLPSYSQEIRLTGEAEINLIICSPGQQNLLTAFGHCAIRIYDPIIDINVVYHYGVLDLNDPQFLTDFINQNLQSNFEVSAYPKFKLNYTFFNRAVYEYPLTLTLQQKQKVFNYLNWNALPENREYTYQYFTGNCSTKLRDVFFKCLEGEIQLNPGPDNLRTTVRNELKPYLVNRPWTGLWFDLFLGPSADEQISTKEKLFLPFSLLEGFEKSKIRFGNEYACLLSTNQRTEFMSYPSLHAQNNLHPLVMLGLTGTILCCLSIWDYRKNKISAWVDWVAFTITGIIGILLLTGWLAYDHEALAFNMNLLWALPSNFLVMLLPAEIRIRYFAFSIIITILLLITWAWLPQKLNYAFAPIAIGLASRYWIQWRSLNTSGNNSKTKMSSLAA